MRFFIFSFLLVPLFFPFLFTPAHADQRIRCLPVKTAGAAVYQLFVCALLFAKSTGVLKRQHDWAPLRRIYGIFNEVRVHLHISTGFFIIPKRDRQHCAFDMIGFCLFHAHTFLSVPLIVSLIIPWNDYFETTCLRGKNG